MSKEIKQYNNQFNGLVGQYTLTNGVTTLAGFLSTTPDNRGPRVMLMADPSRSHRKATYFNVYDPQGGGAEGWWSAKPLGEIVVILQPNHATEVFQGISGYYLDGEFVTKLICNHMVVEKNGTRQEWFKFYPPRSGVPGSLAESTGSLDINNSAEPKGWKAPKELA